MGYYTKYDLHYEGQITEQEILMALIRANPGYFDNADTLEMALEEPIKWYSCEEDMLEVSKNFPNVMFTLEGEGEEQGDMWIDHFKNGKMQRRNVIYTFEPFDPTIFEEGEDNG